MSNETPHLHAGPDRPCSWTDVWKKTASQFVSDNALRLSAALAYYSIFSIAPLLVITLALAGLFLGNDAATGQLYDTMRGYVGSHAASAVQAMVESASKPKASVIATVLGGITLLLGAAGVLAQLKDALNTMWGVKMKDGLGVMGFMRNKFLNFGMVLVIGLLLLFSLIVSSSLSALNKHFETVLQLPPWVWVIIASVASLLVITALFAILFKFLPDARIRWRDVWVGAAITGILFEIGKAGLGWYLGRESTADAYGPATSVVLLLLWVYYASAIFLFGAEYTQVHAESKGHKLEPSSNAEIAPRAADVPKPAAEEAEKRQQNGIEAWTPSDGTSSTGYTPPPPFGSHTLIRSALKYLEARGLLLSIEAREAFGQMTGLLIKAGIASVLAFVAWILLAVALVGVLTLMFHWSWVAAAALAGGLHIIGAIILGLIIWRGIKSGSWFKDTFNELRKDRAWLKGTKN